MTTSLPAHLGHHYYHKILLIDFVVLNGRVILQDFTSIYQLLARHWEVVFPPLRLDLLLQGLYLEGAWGRGAWEHTAAYKPMLHGTSGSSMYSDNRLVVG